MKKQIFHDAAAGCPHRPHPLYHLFTHLCSKYLRPVKSRLYHRPSDGSTSGSRCPGLALLYSYLGSHRYSLQLWQAIIQP